MAVNCQERDSLESLYPCLNCHSMHDLLALMALILSNANGTFGNVPALEAGASKFRNIGDLEFARELIAAAPSALTEHLDFVTLGSDFACLKCYGDSELKAIILNQWCEYNS